MDAVTKIVLKSYTHSYGFHMGQAGFWGGRALRSIKDLQRWTENRAARVGTPEDLARETFFLRYNVKDAVRHARMAIEHRDRVEEVIDE